AWHVHGGNTERARGERPRIGGPGGQGGHHAKRRGRRGRRSSRDRACRHVPGNLEQRSSRRRRRADGGARRHARSRPRVLRRSSRFPAQAAPAVTSRTAGGGKSLMRFSRFFRIVFALVSVGVVGWTFAQTPATPLRVIAFDGGWNLPVWAAQRQGFFEANGVAVQLAFTP